MSVKILPKLFFVWTISILLFSSCNNAPSPFPPEQNTISHTIQPTITFTLPPTALPTPTNTYTTTYTPTITSTPTPHFRFVVNADMAFHSGPGEYDTEQYFLGQCKAIHETYEPVFMISVGDTTFPGDTLWTIHQVFGETFIWFPVVGNHEINEYDMNWLRNFSPDINGDLEPNIVNRGPSGCEQTNYSFDFQNVHFVILNVYCDLDNDIRTDGAIVDALYEWLKDDLEQSQLPIKLVFGHEPAFPQPDQDNGISRQVGTSLDQYPITRDRFWNLLAEENITAYFTSHTHSYSIVNFDGVWQVDVGHSMGARTQATKSTFVIIEINGNEVNFETWRAGIDEIYILTDSGILSTQ